jgi:hypothetical protein
MVIDVINVIRIFIFKPENDPVVPCDQPFVRNNLQSLHFNLQSCPLQAERIKVVSLYQTLTGYETKDTF